MKIAIIGSGISGLGAAHVLHKTHEIAVFEKEDRPGGHSRTIHATGPTGTQPVDTGFIVYNEVNYPNFTRLLRELNVPTSASNMSFGMHSPIDGFSYSSRGVRGLLATPSNLINPEFYRMVRDIFRFNHAARQAVVEYDHTVKKLSERRADNLEKGVARPPLTEGDTLSGDDIAHGETLRSFLYRHRFSEAFIRYYLAPMSSAIWSAEAGQTLEYPALTLFKFFQNHGLLSISPYIPWRTIRGGSETYVRALIKPFEDRIRLNTPVQRVHRRKQKIYLDLDDGPEQEFDAVVMACHAHQTLKLLAEPTREEQQLLALFPYQANQVVLHNDVSVMPPSRAAWASWNVQVDRLAKESVPLAMHYHMNRLQNISGETQYLVTLNPEKKWLDDLCEKPEARTLYDKTILEHPAYGPDSFKHQWRLASLNGIRNTYYCGAYFGYGFHEDGLCAGINAARALGVEWLS